MSKELATLGGGCFWCLEPLFAELRGVDAVTSGYSGGAANASYEEVCSGSTGHAEVVQIAFDPQMIGFDDLLRVFFTVHDPTTPNRQGADVGTQYRSAVFYHSEAQREITEQVMAEIEAQKIWPAPLVTELTPFDEFFPAEAYHQDYYARNPNQGYCRVVIAPKVAKFRKLYAEQLKV
ncbi:MAG: peptide-methionine (S)-S-oxide reductase MsrA [Chloroflexi bacterium]|nr:peptide-methionine (S)-S-oxide reductase MsrA [Chloroflexota bacterium]